MAVIQVYKFSLVVSIFMLVTTSSGFADYIGKRTEWFVSDGIKVRVRSLDSEKLQLVMLERVNATNNELGSD